MPRYRVSDPASGQTLVLEGDSPPTEQELNDIFAARTTAPAPAPRPDYPTLEPQPVPSFEQPTVTDAATPEDLNRLEASLALRRKAQEPPTIGSTIGAATELVALPGNLAYNAAADLISKIDPQGAAYSGNLQAFAKKEKTPAEQLMADVAKTQPTLSFAAKFASGIPALASMGGPMKYLPAMVNRLIGAGFTVDMLSKAPEQFEALAFELYKPDAERDPEALVNAWNGVVQTVGLSPLAAYGAVHKLGIPEKVGAIAAPVTGQDLTMPPGARPTTPWPLMGRDDLKAGGREAIQAIMDKYGMSRDDALAAREWNRKRLGIEPLTPAETPAAPSEKAPTPPAGLATAPPAALFQPGKPAKARVPEGPTEPPESPEPLLEPPARKEIATWEDAVAELGKRGNGTETRRQIQAMFPQLQLSSEVAAKLARETFGTEWRPGGQTPQPTKPKMRAELGMERLPEFFGEPTPPPVIEEGAPPTAPAAGSATTGGAPTPPAEPAISDAKLPEQQTQVPVAKSTSGKAMTLDGVADKFGKAPEFIQAAMDVEAKDHPEIAKTGPQFLLQIVHDELGLDPKAYDGEVKAPVAKSATTSPKPKAKVPAAVNKDPSGKPVESAAPETGRQYFRQDPESWAWYRVRYDGVTGRMDQYQIHQWTWMDGPNNGKTSTQYGQAGFFGAKAQVAEPYTPSERGVAQDRFDAENALKQTRQDARKATGASRIRLNEQARLLSDKIKLIDQYIASEEAKKPKEPVTPLPAEVLADYPDLAPKPTKPVYQDLTAGSQGGIRKNDRIPEPNPPELQTPEDFTAGEVQKLATSKLEDLDKRHPTSFAFDLSEWTSNAKAEAQGIAGVFAYSPEGTDRFIVEFPAGTRPQEAIQSLVQALRQGDGPGSSWLPIQQAEAIKAAFRSGKPVLADTANQHGIGRPRGYVETGGIYRRVDSKASGAQQPSQWTREAGLASQTAPKPVPPPATAPPEAKAETKPAAPFKLTFRQFLDAPREGPLLEALRTLPRREKSPEEVAAIKATDAAMEALDKAGLSWMIDHPEQGAKISKAKRKIWDAYNKAWQERGRVEKAHAEEAQRFLYDEMVKAGHIENAEGSPAKAAAKVEAQVQKVARTEGQRPAKEVKSELVARLEKAIEDAPSESIDEGEARVSARAKVGRRRLGPTQEVTVAEIRKDPSKWDVATRAIENAVNSLKAAKREAYGKVTIDIPGDGTFTVFNTKEALTTLLERAKKLSTSAGKTKGFTENKPTHEQGQEWLKEAEQPAPQPEPAKPAGPGDLSGPGSPAATQPSDPAAAGLTEEAQLMDALKGVPLTDKSGRTTISMADHLADLKTTGRDMLTKWWARTKAGAEQYKRLLFGAPLSEDTFWGVKKDWAADRQVNSGVAREMIEQGKRSVPKPLMRQAMGKYAQALAFDDPEATLREWATGAKLARNRAQYEAAQRLTPDQKHQVKLALLYYEAKGSELQKLGLLNELIENYSGQHMVDMRNSAPPEMNQLRADLIRGTFNTNFKYGLRRVFETEYALEQKGYTLKTTDLFDKLANYAKSANDVLADRKAIRRWMEGDTPDGKPLFATGQHRQPIQGEGNQALLVNPKVRPDPTWIPPESREQAKALDRQISNLRAKAAKAKKADNEDFDYEGTAAQIAELRDQKNALAVDISGEYVKIDHPAFKKWQWAETDPEGKQIFVQGDVWVHKSIADELKNTFGRSHLYDIPGVDTATRVNAQLKGLKLVGAFHQVKTDVHAFTHLVNPFSAPRVDPHDPFVFQALRDGLQLFETRNAEMFSEGLSSSSLIQKIPGIGPVLRSYQEFLFQDHIPAVKLATYRAALARNLKRYGGKLDEGAIRQITATQVNSAYGELNWKLLGVNPTFLHGLRLALLAPDFQAAQHGFVAQMLTRFGGENRMSAAIMVAGVYTISRILNQIFDGNPHFEPKRAFGVVIGGREYGIRTIASDAMRVFSDTSQYIYHRLAPVLSSVAEYVSKTDTLGRKETSTQALKNIGLRALPMPVTPRADLSFMESAMASTFGYYTKRASPVTDAAQLATKWRKAHDPKWSDEVTQYPISDYVLLRQALEDDNTARARSELVALLKTRIIDDIKEVLSQERPFTGSETLEPAFLASLSPTERATVAKARTEQKTTYAKFLRLLYSMPR